MAALDVLEMRNDSKKKEFSCFVFNIRRYGIHCFCFIAVALLVCGCVDKKLNERNGICEYSYPQVPFYIHAKSEKLNYIALNFWNNYSFNDSTLVGHVTFAEKLLAEYLSLLQVVDDSIRSVAVFKLIEQIDAGASMQFLTRFADLLEFYLYDPNSPYKNEEVYILFLQYMANSNKAGEAFKVRSRYQLEVALKNRQGEVAANFTYVLSNGKKGKLHDIKSDYTILFFNNPDCADCKRVKEILATAPIFVQNHGLKIVAIYPDEDLELWRKTEYPESWINGYNEDIEANGTYDLRAIPTLYLLDSEKRVILKDANIQTIADWMDKTMLL